MQRPAEDRTATEGQKCGAGAPSFYTVSKNDRTINPDLERFMAKRMNATTIELDASHLSIISKAKEVADLIMKAASTS